jgi:hypothetical protein
MGILLGIRNLMREHLTARRAELALLVSVVMYFVLSRALFDIPLCLFACLGIRCPTCGTTRAVWQILHGHFSLAWSLNPIGYLVVFILFRRILVLSFRFRRVVPLLVNQTVDSALMTSFFLAGFMKLLRFV